MFASCDCFLLFKLLNNFAFLWKIVKRGLRRVLRRPPPSLPAEVMTWALLMPRRACRPPRGKSSSGDHACHCPPREKIFCRFFSSLSGTGTGKNAICRKAATAFLLWKEHTSPHHKKNKWCGEACPFLLFFCGVNTSQGPQARPRARPAVKFLPAGPACSNKRQGTFTTFPVNQTI